tara:strand:+ start:2989 stop:4857 length:1869 start_codon:yes stop_codon:yes gene_type:complete
MAYFRLALKPGIDKQNTEYGAEGGWTNCDNVRFRFGLPEKIGGWTYFNSSPNYLVGQTNEVFSWNNLSGTPYLAVGTNRKVYVSLGGAWSDITPIRAITAAGDVTFAAVSGSPILTVTDTAHNALQGDFVTFSGAASLGGVITADILNSEWQITEVTNSSTYTITAPVSANGSDTGNGGSSVVGTYQINVGSDVSYFDFGFGIGTWGAETWGTARSQSTEVTLFSRAWKFDNFGQVLILQLVDGRIFSWNPDNGVDTRAAPITGAPTASTFAIISSPDRHLICFGTETTVGDPSTQDPLFVRFSDQENINEFAETVTNTAGGQRLSDGNRIMTAVRSRGQILIFTDTSLHGMQYIGPPYTFGFQQLASNCGALGPHCALDVNGLALWMGPEAFYVFDGTVKKIPCTVQDYVFKDINLVQGRKVFAGLNTDYNEITWFYCSFTSDYIDRCVTYNYLENVWSIGSLSRTAWQDVGTFQKPIAAEYFVDSTQETISTIYGLTAARTVVYNQESGVNQADGTGITASLESGYFDMGEGDNMLLMRKFIPDFKDQQGNLTVNLLLRPYPQASASPSSLDPYVIAPGTEKVDTRARGRQIAIKIDSSGVDTNWRYGTLRVDIQPDGLR